MAQSLSLGFGLRFNDLYGRDGLVQVDRHFLDFLAQQNLELHAGLCSARAAPDGIAGKLESDLLVALAPVLEDFLAQLFDIHGPLRDLRSNHHELAPLYSVKRLFVQRRAARKYSAAGAAGFDADALRSAVAARIGGEFTELSFAQAVDRWMQAEADNAEALDLATRYAAWAVHTPEGQHRHAAGVLFKIPDKVDPQR